MGSSVCTRVADKPFTGRQTLSLAERKARASSSTLSSMHNRLPGLISWQGSWRLLMESRWCLLPGHRVSCQCLSVGIVFLEVVKVWLKGSTCLECQEFPVLLQHQKKRKEGVFFSRYKIKSSYS